MKPLLKKAGHTSTSVTRLMEPVLKKVGYRTTPDPFRHLPTYTSKRKTSLTEKQPKTKRGMGKAREAKAFAEFQRGMRELGLAVGHPVEARGVRQSPKSKEYKKRGVAYKRPSARQYFDRGFNLGTSRNIPQANGRVVRKFLRLRKTGTPYWAMK